MPVTQTAGHARVERKSLLAGIRAVKAMVQKQAPYVHIGTDDGLYIEGGGADEHVRYFLSGDSDGEFDHVVTINSLVNAIKGCTEKEIEFSATVSGALSLRVGSIRHTLSLESNDDFASCNYGTTKQLAHFGPAAIAKMIEAISHCGPDETRPVLTGLRITHDDDGITRAVATDSFRLIVKELASNRVEPGTELLLHGKTLLAALKTVPKGAGVKIHSVGSSHVIVDAGISEWSLRIIDGQYPNWTQLVPDYYDNHADVDREELLAAVKDATVLLGASQPVRLEFSDGELGVRAVGETGEAYAVLKLTNHPKLENMVIGMNHQFLRQALANLSGEFVTVMWMKPERPLRFVDALGDHTLNMPVRLSA
jgi:DNA polymerase III sliding clamp (beta) subunit (PCNA family)